MKGILLASLLLAGVTPMTHANLPRAVDGSWYSPLQSGHGLTIERVDSDTAVLFWHVFDLNGEPMTLYVDAKVEGNRMSGDAFAPEGMRFGAFNARELMLPHWGRVTIDFSDCRNAQLRYTADDTAFGTGGMALTRLLPVPDVECHLDLPSGFEPLAGQRIRGEIDSMFKRLIGVVASDGKIHLTTENSDRVGYENDGVFVGTPLPGTPGEPRHDVSAYSNQWYCAALGPSRCAFPAPEIAPHFETSWNLAIRSGAPVAAAVGIRGTGTGSLIYPRLYFWTAPDAGGYFVPPGEKRFPIRYQRHATPADPWPAVVEMELTLSSNGLIVIARDQQPLFFGSWTRTGNQGFDFELRQIGSSAPPFRGYGYDRVAAVLVSPHGLLMIGHNGQTGMALQSGKLD